MVYFMEKPIKMNVMEYRDFHSHGGSPISWMVYFMENPSMDDD